jgi:hypothetical protein
MKIKNVEVIGDLLNVMPTEINGFYRLNEPVTVTIVTDKEKFIFSAQEGYWFDYASIPECFEWFIEPDDPMLVVASFVHDICFNWKYRSCEWSAWLMYELMRYYLKTVKKGIKRLKLKFKSRVVRRAVETNYAERLFNNPDLTDITNRKFSSIIDLIL